MSLYRVVIQQAAPSASHPLTPRQSELRQTLRELQEDIQAATQDAQAAAQAKASAAAKKTTTIHSSSGRRITIGENGIVIGAPVPDVPVLAGPPGGVYTTEPGGMNNSIPPQAVDLAFGFFIMCAVIVIGWPLARAFGRRIERRGDAAAIDPAFAGQLQRIERAVEAMSIEVERISESQRFMAKLQNGAAERGALPSVERR